MKPRQTKQFLMTTNIPSVPQQIVPRPSQLLSAQPVSLNIPNAPKLSISIPNAPDIKLQQNPNIPQAPKIATMRPSQLLSAQPVSLNIPNAPQLNVTVPNAPSLEQMNLQTKPRQTKQFLMTTNIPSVPQMVAPRPSQLLSAQPVALNIPNAPQLKLAIPSAPILLNPNSNIPTAPQIIAPRPSQLLSAQPVSLNIPKAPILTVAVPRAPMLKKFDVAAFKERQAKLRSAKKINTEEPDYKRIVSELEKRIQQLEGENKLLTSENELLKKGEKVKEGNEKEKEKGGVIGKFDKSAVAENETFRRMTLIETRRKSALNPLRNDPGLQLAILMKEKSDLQEINEKMLNMLTEKEVENKDLREEYNNFKEETKENEDKFIEHIQNLEDELEILKANPGAGNVEGIEQLIAEYNEYKNRMEKEIANYKSSQELLNQELEDKTQTLQKMKADIQRLEMDNLQFINKESSKEESAEQLNTYNNLISQIEVLKLKLRDAEDKAAMHEDNSTSILQQKDEEIKELSKRYEELQNTLKQGKEDSLAQSERLNQELNQKARDTEIFNKKIDGLQKELDDKTKALAELKALFEKKSQELLSMNENTSRLLETKETTIKQYESKLAEMTEDKTSLIEQNKELLDKLSGKATNSLNDLLESDNKGSTGTQSMENKLLHEEIKALRDRLEVQANDLVTLKSLEEQLKAVKEQNEKLAKECDSLRKNKEEEKDDLMKASLEKKTHDRWAKRQSFMPTEIPFANTIVLKREIDMLKQMKDNDNKYFQDQIEKLQTDLANERVKALTQNLENEQLIINYRNIINTVKIQCKKQGIALNMKFDM